MSTVYFIGAGASHGYTASPTGVQPPLAADFFDAYSRLHVSEDLGVKVGWIVNYVRERYGLVPEHFGSFKMDAEEFMTTLEAEIEEWSNRIRSGKEYQDALAWADSVQSVAVFDQALFLFTTILNEITNGPLYEAYVELAMRLRDGDSAITLNWDTLLDKAFYEATPWRPDGGYGVGFNSVFEDEWRLPERSSIRQPTLIKLHGSTNWLTRYMTRDLRTGSRSMLTHDPSHIAVGLSVETGEDLDHPRFERRLSVRGGAALAPYDPSMLRPLCFISGSKPFDAFDGRFRPGYGRFTYFYPPLDPDDRVPTSPLIVAPVRHKSYDAFPILGPLWSRAATLIAEADRIAVIGFSFPPTDLQARELFTPGRHRRQIEIVNPSPERPLRTLRARVGDLDDVSHKADSLAAYLSLTRSDA